MCSSYRSEREEVVLEEVRDLLEKIKDVDGVPIFGSTVKFARDKFRAIRVDDDGKLETA